MTAAYTLLHDLAHQMEPPADGARSQTVHQDDRLKALLFHFSADRELSEHTVSTPAIMYFLEGKAEVRLGDGDVTARAGTWIQMPARLTHSMSGESLPICRT